MRQLAFHRTFNLPHSSLGGSKCRLGLPLASTRPLHVVADICVTPLGKKESPSVSKEIASMVEIIRDSGLKNHLHACGTNVEGEWDEVFNVVKKCHDCLHDKGFPAVSTSIRCGTRTDKQQSLHDKVDHVEDILGSKEEEKESFRVHSKKESGGGRSGNEGGEHYHQKRAAHSKASQHGGGGGGGGMPRSEEIREKGREFISREDAVQSNAKGDGQGEGAGAGIGGGGGRGAHYRGVEPKHPASKDSQWEQSQPGDPLSRDAPSSGRVGGGFTSSKDPRTGKGESDSSITDTGSGSSGRRAAAVYANQGPQSTDSQWKHSPADDPQTEGARRTGSQSQDQYSESQGARASESQWGGQNSRETQSQESRSKHGGEQGGGGSIGGPLAGGGSKWTDTQNKGEKTRDPHSKTYSK